MAEGQNYYQVIVYIISVSNNDINYNYVVVFIHINEAMEGLTRILLTSFLSTH